MRKTKPGPKIWLAIPLMAERDNLPALLEDVNAQTYKDFEVVCCVNQPDQWWDDPQKLAICENNSESLVFLAANSHFRLIDCASRGLGWTGKKYGVGWARKTAMDECNRLAGPGDLILTLDGDTRFQPDYLTSVAENMGSHPKITALSVPYYHKLTGNSLIDRAILRYEIYMRYYVINLWRIGSPYSFTALGSAMVVPVWAYRAIGGMTPNKSGEDFYFLQKLRKFGDMLYWNESGVYPEARFSDRVFFGTGPAMIKGAAGDWGSYPVYSHTEFDLIGATYAKFESLFSATSATPMDDFLKDVFGEADPWQALRLNHPDPGRFIRACHEKLDGLRLLQFLKSRNDSIEGRDEDHLREFLLRYYPEAKEKLSFPFLFTTFQEASDESLNVLRDFLKSAEEIFQKQHFLQQS